MGISPCSRVSPPSSPMLSGRDPLFSENLSHLKWLLWKPQFGRNRDALTSQWAHRGSYWGSYWFLGQLQERRVCAPEHSWAEPVSLRHALAWGPLDSWHLDFTYSLGILHSPYTISSPHLACASRIYSAPCQDGGIRFMLCLWDQSIWEFSSLPLSESHLSGSCTHMMSHVSTYQAPRPVPLKFVATTAVNGDCLYYGSHILSCSFYFIPLKFSQPNPFWNLGG